MTYATQNAILYRGFQLYVEEPAWVADTTGTVTRRVTELGTPIGRSREIVRNLVSKSNITFNWICDTRDEIDVLMEFLYRRRGSYEPVWMPSWKHDLWLMADVGLSDTTITIKACGYSTQVFPSENRVHLILLDPICQYVIRRVIGAVDNGDGTETLTLESAIGRAFTKRETEICFLMLMRQVNDATDLSAPVQDVYTATVEFTEVPDEIGQGSGQPIGAILKYSGFCGAGPDLAAQGWTQSGDHYDFYWYVNTLGCFALYGGSSYSAPSTSINTKTGDASRTFTGFTPGATVLVQIEYAMQIVVANDVQFAMSSGSDNFTRNWHNQAGNYPNYLLGQYKTVADGSGNVTVDLHLSGTHDVTPATPSIGVLVEYGNYMRKFRMYEL